MARAKKRSAESNPPQAGNDLSQAAQAAYGMGTEIHLIDERASDPSYQVMTVPQHLRRAREKAGLHIEHLAEELRIRSSYLAALENGQYHELPANAYVIGFLRTYANRLGLDGEVILDLYRREMQGRTRSPQLVLPQPISEGKAPNMPVIIVSVVVALLVYAMWGFFSSPHQAVVEPATPAVETEVDKLTQPQTQTEVPATTVDATMATTVATPVPEPSMGITLTGEPSIATVTGLQSGAQIAAATAPAPVAEASAPAEAPKPAPKKGKVYGENGDSRYSLYAEEESWVAVQDSDGLVVFSRQLKAGDSLRLPDEKGLTVTAGNAGGLVFTADGAEMPRLGGSGQAVKNLNLDNIVKKANKNKSVQ